MRSSLWILAVMSSTAFAQPIDLERLNRLSYEVTREGERNSMIEESILSLLEKLREGMVTGAGGVPVLDPFYVNYLRLNGEEYGLSGSYLEVSEMDISNLSKFAVENLSVTATNILLQRYRLILDVRVPTLHLKSNQYDILLQVLGYNIFGKGRLSVSVVEPRVTANVEVGLRISTSGVYVTLRETEVNFTLLAFDSNITGLFNNEIASDFANRFLSYLVPDLVHEYQKEITTALSDLVLEVGNEILKDVNIIDIIG